MRRAALCTTACWPKFCEHLPCSSTHPITPDPTLCISGGTLKKRTAKISNCRLCFARRWDLKRQTLSLVGPTPPPRFRYSAPRLSSRPGWCCPVEHLRAYVLCWLAMGAAHVFVLLSAVVGSTFHPMQCINRMHADIVCGSVLKEISRECRPLSGGGDRTGVQHISVTSGHGCFVCHIQRCN